MWSFPVHSISLYQNKDIKMLGKHTDNKACLEKEALDLLQCSVLDARE